MIQLSQSMQPTEQIALWADRLRDLAATGLKYADDPYDRERYETFQEMAMEMLALATGQPLDALVPLKATLFSRMSPVVTGSGAVIDEAGKILLMRRSDNGLWVMPGGQMEVGETPAQAVVREVVEETGIRCVPVALSGVYDSRLWDTGRSQHIYKFTFLCKPISREAETPSHAHESLAIGWFAKDNFPDDLYEGHVKRIDDAYRVYDGELQAYFDCTAMPSSSLLGCSC